MDIGIFKLFLFCFVSVYLWYISRASLRVVRSHGFYRFFAWEAIIALILVNIGSWFSHPFSILQIISWIFLIVSLLLLWNGVYLIWSTGKPSEQRQDSTLYLIEKTSVLVTSGIYKYIRHPLYSSLLFLAWGSFLKDVTWPSICLVVTATIFLVLTGKADEAECIEYFGSSYNEYMLHTKMFVPFLF
jgi:protein-S-isoprenylcysteine O-methyltransferase Ste14